MGSWKKYVWALIINSALALVVLFVRGFDLKIYYVDAFGIGGAVSVFLGLLFWIADAGAFDTIGYGFASFRGSGIYKDLYDYTVRKREKRRRKNKAFLPYLVVGGVFLAISFLLSAGY